MATKDEGKLETGTAMDEFYDGSESPEPAKEEKADVVDVEATVEDKGPKVVKYQSRWEQLFLTITPKQVVKDGQGRLVKEVPSKTAIFNMCFYSTSDPEVIEWIDRYIASDLCAVGDVFRVPEIDPLTQDGMFDRLDQMQLPELRVACRERTIKVSSNDDETVLRYKLLKHLSGMGSKEEKTNNPA